MLTGSPQLSRTNLLVWRKIQAFQTSANSLYLQCGWISVGPFAMGTLLRLDDGILLHVFAGGLTRAQCSPITSKVRFHYCSGVVSTLSYTDSAVTRCMPRVCQVDLGEEPLAFIVTYLDRQSVCSLRRVYASWVSAVDTCRPTLRNFQRIFCHDPMFSTEDI